MDYSASSPLDKLIHAARAEAAFKSVSPDAPSFDQHQNAIAGPSRSGGPGIDLGGHRQHQHPLANSKPKPSFVVHRPTRNVVRPELTPLAPITAGASSFQLFMPSEPTSPFSPPIPLPTSSSSSNPTSPYPTSSTSSTRPPSLHTRETTSFFPDLHRLSSYSNVHRDLSDVRSLAGESGWVGIGVGVSGGGSGSAGGSLKERGWDNDDEGEAANRSSSEGEWPKDDEDTTRRSSRRASSTGTPDPTSPSISISGLTLRGMGYKGREAPAPPVPTPAPLKVETAVTLVGPGEETLVQPAVKQEKASGTQAEDQADVEKDAKLGTEVEDTSPPETPTSTAFSENMVEGLILTTPTGPRRSMEPVGIPGLNARAPVHQASQVGSASNKPEDRQPAPSVRPQPNQSQASIAGPDFTRPPSSATSATVTVNPIPTLPSRPIDMGEHYLSLGIALHHRSGLSSSTSSSNPTTTSSTTTHLPSDLSNAALNFKRSMEAGSLGGRIMYGLSLRHGWGIARDEGRGFEVLSGACREVMGSKDPVGGVLRRLDKKLSHELVLAIYEVGICFSNGWGVKQDGKKAVSYFRIAAEFGDRDAQEQLGHLYTNGKHGVKKDLAEAAKWYRAAVAQGASSVGLSWIYKDKYTPCC